jgi:hypothetical protein
MYPVTSSLVIFLCLKYKNMKNKTSFLLLYILFFSLLVPAFSQVCLPKLIRNSLLLQRGIKAKIWDWTAKGEKVSVSFLNPIDIVITDNKNDVGKRLTIAALNVACNNNSGTTSGPVYQSMKIKNEAIIQRLQVYTIPTDCRHRLSVPTDGNNKSL